MPSKDTIVDTVNIYETRDYDKFTHINGNRKINPAHVRGLERSIINGDLSIDNPIEVTEKFEVLDGQHRLLAYKHLKLPVYYIFKKKNTSISIIRTLNSNRKNWNWYDYAVSYRDELKNKNYTELLDLYEETGEQFQILMLFSTGNSVHDSAEKKRFQNGEFVMKVNYEKALQQLGIYQELKKAGNILLREFAPAVYKFINTTTYNHQKMLEKVRSHRSAFYGCYLTNDFSAVLQDIWRA